MSRPLRYRYKAEILEVLKPDLFKVRIDLGFHLYRVITTKLAGILCTSSSPQTVEFVRKLVAEGSPMVEVQTLRELKGVWLSTVLVNGASLNTKLLKSGVAEEFKQ